MNGETTSAHYGRSFYDAMGDSSVASARGVLPLVLELLKPDSLVDIGCGTGVWAEEARRLGVLDVVGIDGAYVPKDQRRLPPEQFLEKDLSQPLAVGRTFSLALCLEVAEHLPATHADHLIAEIVALSSAVLFSAATPLQGGTDHINEQWPDYWISKFESRGYTCWDVVRPQIRYRSDVAWIYRQNLMLVLAPDSRLIGVLPVLSRLRAPVSGDVAFEYVARYLLEREDGLKRTVLRLPQLLRQRARRLRR